MSSFLDKLIKENSKKKEAVFHTPIARITTKISAKNVTFRKAPCETMVTEHGETIKEEIATDELHLNQSGFDSEEDLFGTQLFDNNQQVEKSMKPKAICPFEIGEKLMDFPMEQLPTYRRQLYNSMFPRLSFNYDTVNYIANNGDFSDCKTLALGMKGLMEMMELQHQKFTPKKPSESTAEILATLDPSSFLTQEHVEVESLNGTEFISSNRVFASVTAQSGTLRSVVQCLANAWISEIMSLEDRVLYSTSEKPKPPQLSLPTRFLNLPIPLIVNCVNLNCTKDSTVQLNISLFFKLHITNLFNQARSDAKTGRRKRKHISSGTPEE